MTGAFQYRPKFVDIRVKPDGETMERARGERACDHVGCSRAGVYKAPKGRDVVNEYWWFCFEHVADYNRRWNYFSGMSEGELAAYLHAEETGHRPTWTFRADKTDRLSAAMRGFSRGRGADPFAMFQPGAVAAPAGPRRRRLTRLQTLALEALALDETAGPAQIRARYVAEVKRWHPDSNGGDRGAEQRLQKVVQAYQTLKAAGLV